LDIVVCIKAVCMAPVRFSLSNDGERIDCGSRTLVMNEIDEYAIEQALVMKEEQGGSVIAITAGGLSSQDILYVAKAKGVDRVLRVDAEYSDPALTAGILAKVIESLHYDLILTGVESSDNMAAQTGISLAVRLGLPFAYSVTAIDMKSSPGFLRLKKEMGGGVSQILDIRPPALLCVQSGIQQLKYTAPAKRIRARQEPIEVRQSDSINYDIKKAVQNGHPRFTKLFKPEITRKAEVIQGKPVEIAPLIIKKILEVS
jgi:electron transfer flavoprotein beta subunit